MPSVRVPALAAILFSLVLADAGCSKAASAGATDQQVATYQANVVANCKDEGRRTGHDPRNVDPFCDCMIKVLKTEVGPADWRSATLFALGGQHDREHALFVAKLDKVNVCRNEDSSR